ncbi:hypothetical protein [Stenotrophomonas phage TS-10]|uniref:Uncharacterized protein n=1 Tax=Stenotrophomonas phage TS-10 TaxID=2886106 RepID=A0AAE9C3F2_9CAUD|nr:hypothetical protein [Stenotrophomonas phage TS-10]
MFGAFMGALGWIGVALALLVAVTYVSLIREVGVAYGSSINWRRNNVAYRYPKLGGVRWAVAIVEYLERIECAERGDFGHRIKQEADTLGGALIVASVFMSISGVHYFIGRIVALF